MKVAYLVDLNNPFTYAGITVAKGFESAFSKREDEFTFFDLKKIQKQFFIKSELRKFNDYQADLVFASVDDLLHLDLDALKSTRFALWGAFYKPCDYEGQAESIRQKTKKVLSKYRDKHQFLIWAQHSEEIIQEFFLGYQSELGLNLIQLLHCADENKIQRPIVDPEIDLLWIGNIAHRKETYQRYIVPLKQITSNYLEYHEHHKIDPVAVENRHLYANSMISPNVHTQAQIKYNMGLNERVFTSSLMGGFQICDNPLARNLFTAEELLILTTPEEFIEAFNYFKQNKDLRMKMILSMQENIKTYHTYSNRIDQIIKAFNK